MEKDLRTKADEGLSSSAELMSFQYIVIKYKLMLILIVVIIATKPFSLQSGNHGSHIPSAICIK